MGQTEFRRSLWSGLAVAALLAPIAAAQNKNATLPNDIPKSFNRPTTGYDYIRRETMIPMRDGVRLHTVIMIPKGASNAPILLTRTPYNASKRATRNNSPHLVS